MLSRYRDADDEPGVPGQLDRDGRPYFSPSNQFRPADAREQREGFIPRWEYRGHTDSVKDVCVTREDSFGRMRFVSTDGKSTASWLELSDGHSKKLASGEHVINAVIFIPPLNVVAAASGNNLLIFDGRTLRMVSTLPTSKKVLLQLEYNHARDEIISGGSDGCFVWRLEAIPCELYAAEVVPFELRFLRGFKGCAHWAGKMVWDEASQVIITIDGMKVKTYDAVAATNLHTIQKAHESPVTAGLWIGESEYIVTGCIGGYIKVWACQHTAVDGGNNGHRRRRRRIRRRRCRRRGRTPKIRHGQSPALVEQFDVRPGTITGIVRHCLNRSYIVSCSSDGTMRVWDVDQLAPVTSLRLPCAASSFWALWDPGGRCRVVYSEAEGTIRTMVVHQVCQPLSFDTEGAQNVSYSPPLACRIEATSDVSAIEDCDGCLVGASGTRDPPEVGLLLVQMKQGLWGLIPEPTTSETCITTLADKGRGIFTLAESYFSGEEEGFEDSDTATQHGNTTSSLFYAWPPLSCVVERYSFHALSRKRRKVICLANSGVLDTYLFGPAKGEASKVQSRKVDLHTSGATATCMCLLPGTPACVVAALDRVIASCRPSDTSSDGHAGGDDRGGGDTGDEKIVRDRRCGGIGARKIMRQFTGEEFDQVVAVGTSHGGILLVETIVNGTTLDFLEGVFASKVFFMGFCSASTEDDIRGSELVSGDRNPAACTKGAERLVCAGYNANGTVTIKGFAVSSLQETFRLHLSDVPTCVRVASRRPVLALGFADGALNAISFQEDRVHDLENGALIGAHTERINTISFSTRLRCMATGSADGYIMIWDLYGQQLHRIHLQSPALAIEFMEVSGDLLVSSSSGMCCIPPSRWCPLKLLVAKERADRRAAAAAASTTNSDGVSRRALGGTPTPASGEGFASTRMAQADGTITSERGVRVHGGESATLHELSSSKRRPQQAGDGCGGASDRDVNRKGIQEFDGNINGKHEALRAARRSREHAGDTSRDEEEPSAPNDEHEFPPPTAVAGVRDGAELPATSRFKSHLAPREAGGRDPGDRRKFSILDRMKAKLSRMPTSPPPPTPRTTKCPTGSTPNATPASPAMTVKYRRDGASIAHAFTGDRCDQEGETPTSTPSSPPKSEPNPRDGDTISTANNILPNGTTLHWGAGTPAQGTYAGGRSGASSPALAQVPDTLRFLVPGSLPCAKILERDAAALNPEAGPSVPLSSTPRQRCTGSLEDGVFGVGKPIVLKQARASRFPRNASCFSSGLQTTAAPSISEKGGCTAAAANSAAGSAAAGEFDPSCTIPGFAVSGYVIPESVAQRQPAKPEREMHTKNAGIDRRLCNGPGNETSPTTESADWNRHPLFDDLSSDRSIRVPVVPTCRPPSWEEPSDGSAGSNRVALSSVARKGYHRLRPRAATPASAVFSENRRIAPGWTPPTFTGGSGAGTAAAVAAKDVHNVMPTITIPRATGKPCLVADLVGMVSQSLPSPSPPATCGRAFRVISPLSWTADDGIGRLLSTPSRTDSGLCLGAAAIPNGEGGTPFKNSSGVPIVGIGGAFFPVRPRAGRRTPVLAGRARCLRAEVR